MPRLLILAFALIGAPPGQQLLTLEILAFRGTEDVTAQTRVTVHRAGERAVPVAQADPGRERAPMRVTPGIYDAQAVEQHDGRAVNIRWAERLVVMPYPDEAGHHVEVINFTAGYGALEVRSGAATRPESGDVALFPAGARDAVPARPAEGFKHALFVVPAGVYDLQVRRGGRTTWHPAIEVPLDRTRLWILP